MIVREYRMPPQSESTCFHRPPVELSIAGLIAPHAPKPVFKAYIEWNVCTAFIFLFFTYY